MEVSILSVSSSFHIYSKNKSFLLTLPPIQLYTTRDRGSTALHAVYTVDTVETVETVDMF